MRIIDYKENWQKLLSPDIVKQLTLIHEFKGEQRLFIEAHRDELNEWSNWRRSKVQRLLIELRASLLRRID